MDDLIEDKHPDGEFGEYKTSRGWDPNDKYEAERTKRNAAYRRRHPEEFCHTSIFETRPAAEVMHDAAERPRNAQLFGDLWRQGELAVLFAEAGAGKSILAVQIAEAIARGRVVEPFGYPEFRNPHSALRTQKVLYFDFETTEAQFKERYSLPTKTKRVRRYKFAEGFKRATFAEDLHVPEAFNGDLARYIRHSFNLELAKTDAQVLIIDSLSYLDPKGGPAAAVARMRALKLLASTTGLSILVTLSVGTGSRCDRVLKPLSLAHLPRASEIASIADSIFALQRSSLGPDIRYIKHLRARNAPPLYHSEYVLAYRLGRSSTTESTENTKALSAGSPPYQGGVDADELGRVGRRGGSLIATTPHSTLRTPQSQDPFLSFHFLGILPESDAIRDYAAEARARLDAQDKERLRLARRSSKEILVEGLMDGSYARYLKGG